MKGVKLIGAQKASLYSFAEPVTAAIISTFVLGSPFTVGRAGICLHLHRCWYCLGLPEKEALRS